MPIFSSPYTPSPITVSAALSGLVLGYLIGSGKLSLSSISKWIPISAFTSEQSKPRSKSEDYINRPSSLARRQVLASLEKAFRISKSDLEIICDSFIKELELGLVASRQDLGANASQDQLIKASTLPMLPAYVDRLPNGNESGVFLAVDFGGTHVRIIKVVVDESSATMPSVVEKPSSSSNLPAKFRLIQSKLIVPDELKHGSGRVLFDYIADGVASFLKQHPISHSTDSSRHATMPNRIKPSPTHQRTTSFTDQTYIPLGFTFSFPVKQTAVNRGTIILWNKDFKCDDVLGKDPVQLLQDALIRKGVSHVKVAALVNDTVGTLVAHAYEHPQAMIGLILGTGSNACYIEDYENIIKLHENKEQHLSHMVMNTEFGAFNPDARQPSSKKRILPRTKYDEIVDKSSLNHGNQVYEKMVSGYYLGEIVRLVLIELIEDGKLFADATWKVENDSKYGIIAKPHSFDTSYMSRIERDHSTELADTKSVFEDTFDIYDTTASDRQLVKFICELVAIRSARLSAAIIAGIVAHLGFAKMLFHIRNPQLAPKKIVNNTPPSDGSILSSSNDNVIVAIDGSLFEFYPHYGNRMMDALRELFGARADSIQLSLAKDGSGLGAALIAAIASTGEDGKILVSSLDSIRN